MRWYQAAGLALAVLVGVLLLALAAYIGYVVWDEHRLRSICSKMVPGMTVADARKIVEDGGLGGWVRPMAGSNVPGVFDEKTKTWFFAVPAPTTVGDLVCGVTHDGRVVLSAEVLGQ